MRPLPLILFLALTGLLFAKDRPNVIYILADDLGYGDLGCYGQQTLATPAIDRLAAEGARFTRHYSGSTVCAPSRAVLLTGLHTGHVSVKGNGEARLQETTVADVLKKEGYATACIGKWGVGHPPPLDDPNQHGFDYFYGYVNMFHAHNFYPSFIVRNGEMLPLRNVQMEAYRSPPPGKEGAGVAEVAIDYAPELITQEALNFVRRHKDEPFFLYYALNIPHANNEGGRHGRGMEVPHYGPFENKPWPEPEKGFAAMMQRIDRDVSRLLDLLKELKLEENTLIFFSSDNGPHQEGGHMAEFFNSNGGKRGIKRDLYEGGVRVPLIVRWPKVIEAGRVVDAVTGFQDLMPTVCELLGVKAPQNDGLSMLPILQGRSFGKRDRVLYWDFGERGGKEAVLQGDWKLLRLGEEKPIYELYNVMDDPSEEKNLMDDRPEKVGALMKLLQSISEEGS